MPDWFADFIIEPEPPNFPEVFVFFSFLQILPVFGRRHKRGWASTWLVAFTLNLEEVPASSVTSQMADVQ